MLTLLEKHVVVIEVQLVIRKHQKEIVEVYVKVVDTILVFNTDLVI